MKEEENEVKDPIAAVLAEASLPPYTCNIYEGLMVFTINVRNVKVDSLQKAILKDEKGYQLSFHTVGQGLVPFHYGFCLAFDFNAEAGSCQLDDLEIEIWDNNMILQLSMPKSGCTGYQVGICHTDLGSGKDILPLPRLEAVKEKCFLMGKKVSFLMKNQNAEKLVKMRRFCTAMTLSTAISREKLLKLLKFKTLKKSSKYGCSGLLSCYPL